MGWTALKEMLIFNMAHFTVFALLGVNYIKFQFKQLLLHSFTGCQSVSVNPWGTISLPEQKLTKH